MACSDNFLAVGRKKVLTAARKSVVRGLSALRLVPISHRGRACRKQRIDFGFALSNPRCPECAQDVMGVNSIAARRLDICLWRSEVIKARCIPRRKVINMARPRRACSPQMSWSASARAATTTPYLGQEIPSIKLPRFHCEIPNS
jgi:hypothetical protein